MSHSGRDEGTGRRGRVTGNGGEGAGQGDIARQRPLGVHQDSGEGGVRGTGKDQGHGRPIASCSRLPLCSGMELGQETFTHSVPQPIRMVAWDRCHGRVGKEGRDSLGHETQPGKTKDL